LEYVLTNIIVSSGAIAGIACGAFAALAIVGLVVFVLRRNMRKKELAPHTSGRVEFTGEAKEDATTRPTIVNEGTNMLDERAVGGRLRYPETE
jgi:predicted dinucleotide-utilizing enzyme